MRSASFAGGPAIPPRAATSTDAEITASRAIRRVFMRSPSDGSFEIQERRGLCLLRFERSAVFRRLILRLGKGSVTPEPRGPPSPPGQKNLLLPPPTLHPIP